MNNRGFLSLYVCFWLLCYAMLGVGVELDLRFGSFKGFLAYLPGKVPVSGAGAGAVRRFPFK